MTTSKYFNHNKSKAEQGLFESLCVETIQQSGVDVYYLPATRDEIDDILGESLKTTFGKIMAIEVYLPDGGREGGEGDIMSKFGLAQKSTIEIVMSKKRFIEEAANLGVDLIRPREGDLVFIGDIEEPLGSQVNELFEITYVNVVENAWSFGKTFVYKVTMQGYTYAYETFATNTALDDVMPTNVEEMSSAINNAVQATKATLVRFDKNNPLANT